MYFREHPDHPAVRGWLTRRMDAPVAVTVTVGGHTYDLGTIPGTGDMRGDLADRLETLAANLRVLERP